MTANGPSRLGRLFLYSKGDAVVSQENFTTEALRIAIEDDPAPMVEGLRRADERRANALGLGDRPLRPSSQVELPPRGWLDLVLEVLDERERAIGEVWVEVKIGAGESGDQLAYYLEEAVRRAKAGHPVWVVTLARAQLRPEVVNVTWSELYQCARRGRLDQRSWRQHARWRDFCRFLEEQGVADDALAPVTDVEAASLEASHRLIGKVSAVVRAVEDRVPSILPECTAWPKEGQLLNFIGAYFRSSGQMIGQNGPVS